MILFLAGVIYAQAIPAIPAGQDGLSQSKPLQEPHDKAALIRLNGPVDDMMLRSIKRRVDVALKAGCSLLIFELDTDDGQVNSAIEITKFIKKLPEQRFNTVAWIHDRAFSEGSMIAAACQQIVISSHGSIGDCSPIMVVNEQSIPIAPDEHKDFQSKIVQDFDESARLFGHNEILLRAMVVASIEIHEMHNQRSDETRFVDAPGKTALLAEEVVDPVRGPEKNWKYVKTIDNNQQLLTLGSDLAIRTGLAKAVINNESELQAAMNIRGDMVPMDFSMAERITVFLTSAWIRFLLFVGMCIGAWIEISHPGISVAGISAIVCLILLVGAPFLTGLAQVWEIAFIVIGIAIIIADFVAFGGIGMLAIPGFILMATGLVASFVPAEPEGNWIPTHASTWYAIEKGLSVLVGGTLFAVVGFFFLGRYLSLTPGFNRIQLRPRPVLFGGTSGKSSLGGVSANAGLRDVTDRPADNAVFVGALGLATTDLRPAGKARFGEFLVTVVTDGGFVDGNTEVVVIGIEGTRVIVKTHIIPPPPAGRGPAPDPFAPVSPPVDGGNFA